MKKKANKKPSFGFTESENLEILDILAKMHPLATCELDFASTYQLLVAVMLSAQTTDKSVNKVTPALFAKYPDARTLAAAANTDFDTTLAEISQMIKTIGMYKTKSKNLVLMSIELATKYDGDVPCDYEKLIELPGVGRKTANVVLSVGFGVPRIAVDTHVFRVSNRLGLVCEKDVLKTELALMEVLPKEKWSDAHHHLIFHGRYTCTARNPKCAECKLTRYCKHFAEL